MPLILMNCGETYRIHKEDLRYQTYQKGDILIFARSTGGSDTIWINKVEKTMSDSDPLAIFPDRHQGLWVTGQMTLQKPFVSTIGKLITKESIVLLEIHTGKYGAAYYLELQQPRSNLSCPSVKIDLPVLDSLNQVTDHPNQRHRIEAIPWADNLKDSSYDLDYFEWNLTYGYTALVFKNGYELRLIQMIRKGKNILPENFNS